MLEEKDDSHEKKENDLEIKLAYTTAEHSNMTQKQGETDESSLLPKITKVEDGENATKFRRRWHREPKQMHTYKWAKKNRSARRSSTCEKKYADMNGNFGVVQQILCRGKRVDIFVRR